MATETIIHSHNYQHFEDLQLSAKEFYDMLESIINDYQYPDVKCKREHLKEGGMFSASREYLRISNSNVDYYICASPFGISFFISWWLKESVNDLDRLIDKWLGKKAKSFYQMDTELMFSQSINAIVRTAVNKVMMDHGFRTPEMIAK